MGDMGPCQRLSLPGQEERLRGDRALGRLRCVTERSGTARPPRRLDGFADPPGGSTDPLDGSALRMRHQDMPHGPHQPSSVRPLSQRCAPAYCPPRRCTLPLRPRSRFSAVVRPSSRFTDVWKIVSDMPPRFRPNLAKCGRIRARIRKHRGPVAPQICSSWADFGPSSTEVGWISSDFGPI